MQTYIKFLEKASSREKKFSPSCLRSQFQTLCPVRPGHGVIRRGHIEKQLEQLLQQVTTLRGDIASLRPMQTKGCLLRNNNIQRFALDTFPANCPGDMSLRSLVVSLASLLLVVKVVFVVFPNSAGRIGNNSLSSLTVSDPLSVRCERRQRRDRR
mgnify:CR=1 FL=1